MNGTTVFGGSARAGGARGGEADLEGSSLWDWRRSAVGSNPAQIGPARPGPLLSAQQSWQRDTDIRGEVRLLRDSRQLVEQRLGVLQVCRIEALVEPAVDRRQELVRLGAPALLGPEASE
jgi:hypothetical protein